MIDYYKFYLKEEWERPRVDNLELKLTGEENIDWLEWEFDEVEAKTVALTY